MSHQSVFTYEILSEESIAEIEQAVRRRLEQGWELQGGISVTQRYVDKDGVEHYLCCQAMLYRSQKTAELDPAPAPAPAETK